MASDVLVETSALIAILLREEGWEEVAAKAWGGFVAETSLVQAHMVATGRMGSEGKSLLDGIVADLSLTRLPVGEHEAEAAREAFDRYGKGRGGPLNFGDCLSYGVARSRGLRLHYVGRDFDVTDLAVQ